MKYIANPSLLIFGLLCVLPASVLLAEDAKKESKAELQPVSYHKQIEPILRHNCFGCHQGAKQLGSYLMTDFESLVKGGETGEAAIVPGKPDESFLIDQISPSGDDRAEMPKAPAKPLAESDVELITRWIAEGAENDSPVDLGPRYTDKNPPIYTGPPALPSIDVSPDQKLVAVAGFHEVLLLDANDGKQVKRLVGLSPRINTVRFSPDGKQLVAVGGTPSVSGELQLWDVASGELVLSKQVTFDTITGANWSPDGTKIAFAASDNVVRAVDAKTGERVLFQGAHDDWVRDTTFTPDSTHVISVARDMTTKLTEVATERFIDNITSITPGALSGGLSSVCAHPTRNEILVGGSDGVPKLYRVFRETARKIGDDANLIRSMPKMPGRIFSVQISPDGKYIAAAATLDDKSEIRVWKYDFDGKLPDDLKKIIAKRVKDRNKDETNKVNAHRRKSTEEVVKFSVPDAAVYAVRFAKDNTIFFTSDDGKVRHLDLAGKVIGDFAAVQIDSESKIARVDFDAKAWAALPEQNQKSAEEPIEPSKIDRITVSPETIEFVGPYAYTQLLVTGITQDGATHDLTRQVTVNVPKWATVSSRGVVRPSANGKGSIKIQFGAHTRSIAVSAAGVSRDHAKIGSVDFVQDVNPILSRLGCNQGTCHGAQKGKAGFKLSLRGYDPVYDLRALTDDLAARRINSAAPNESLMLRKPLGISPHQGGTLMSPGDPNHVVLHRWIADGSQLNLDSAKVDRLEVFPVNPIVDSTTASQQVRVVAVYPDGRRRDVTREAFIESGNTEVATAAQGGLLTAQRRGEAPILARYEGAYAATTLTVMGDRSGYADSKVEAWDKIDELVAGKWKRVKVVPSDLCDDATFLRRVYLDITGLPPTSDRVRKFLADKTPTQQKRAKLVDELIGSDAYVDFWTNKWADLLQVNRKFLGVEGSQKFRAWIREGVAKNMPYNEFAHQILTASGSNNDNPAASYFKILREPEATMENTTHLFLGIRFNCNKCHDHPFERWTQDQYYELSAYFAQVKLENDPASGKRKIGGTAVEGAKPLFEKVVDKNVGDVKHPKTSAVVKPDFPYPVAHEAADGTRREQLAKWMTDGNNPYFARSYVNRLWGYLLGVGLIEPIDDIRAGNPPTNPELLQHLTDEFVASGFNTQEMLRKICNSRTYQLSVKTNPLNHDDAQNYSHALPRRLPAEVIYDSVHQITGAVSSIPGMPKGTRAAAITDSGVQLADGFLQNLGRPARESACECERSSELQLGPVMALISGPTIGTAIADPKNELEQIVKDLSEDKSVAEEIYLRALGRLPKDSELAAFDTMKQMIKDDHRRLQELLAKAEAKWKTTRGELEKLRNEKLAKAKEAIVARTKEIQPERDRLAKEREAKIKTAQEQVDKAKSAIDAKLDKFASSLHALPEWVPLVPSKATATNKAVLSPQSDRSILASGSKEKGVYNLEFRTSLKNITGFRLEALSDPSLPAKGPGLPANGNFVVTEFEVNLSPQADPKKRTPVKIKSGLATFSQQGFSPAASFNGRKNDQGGWAVSPQMGRTHWITYKLDKPIENKDGVIHISLHQFHNAGEHRLGKFRISATTHAGNIPLGYSEEILAVLSSPKASRSDEQKNLLAAHVSQTDADLKKANEALAAASKAVPADAKLVQLQQRQKMLETPTPDDPKLIQLREDAKQSGIQVQNLRLTAAEDLTWALINSPAFLFNH